MWNEQKPKWRTAQKQHQCQGDGCSKVIERGERYLDRAGRHLENQHLRYCQTCAAPVLERADNYHRFRGRSDFRDRYQQHISSPDWMLLKNQILAQRGNRCERCGQSRISLELHHLHYRSLGNEQPEDVELLCQECHTLADEERTGKCFSKRSNSDEGLIVGPDGDYWGKFEPDTTYIPLPDGRPMPVNFKGKR
jgi:5-methylcytosine-specific restriction endonuclease McrA